ncbi:MAG TPA: N-acetyltransferase [Propionibacterium sp.]|nr:N-acetyltransferase [Propionibacterium sp.]
MAEVTKNTDESRFEIHVDGELAGWLDYTVGRLDDVVLPHTFVEDRFGGQGLAGELVRAGLDDIRKQGYRVDPQCPYVQGWIEKNPEYHDLVADSSSFAKGLGREAAEAVEDLEDVAGVDAASDPRI